MVKMKENNLTVFGETQSFDEKYENKSLSNSKEKILVCMYVCMYVFIYLFLKLFLMLLLLQPAAKIKLNLSYTTPAYSITFI